MLLNLITFIIVYKVTLKETLNSEIHVLFKKLYVVQNRDNFNKEIFKTGEWILGNYFLKIVCQQNNNKKKRLNIFYETT